MWMYTHSHACMHACSLCNYAWQPTFASSVMSVLIRVTMMLPAKTPTHHIISCCSKLSCLITAIKLCVSFVHKFWRVNTGVCVCSAVPEWICNNILLCNSLKMFISSVPAKVYWDYIFNQELYIYPPGLIPTVRNVFLFPHVAHVTCD